MSLLKGLPWLAAATLLSGFAQAATVTYDDRAAWTSNVTDVVNRTFDGYTSPGGYADFSNSGGLTVAGVNFVGKYGTSSYFLHVVEANGSQPWYEWNSGAVLRGDSSAIDRTLIVTLPLSTFAFGMDLATGGINASDLTIRINGTTNYTVTTLNRPNLKFFGLTSTEQITLVEILFPTTNIYPMLDNFATANVGGGGGTPEETPEVASLLLCATGLVWIARTGRKRLRAVRSPLMA